MIRNEMDGRETDVDCQTQSSMPVGEVGACSILNLQLLIITTFPPSIRVHRKGAGVAGLELSQPSSGILKVARHFSVHDT